MHRTRSISLVFLVAFVHSASAQIPDVYVDPGACPGEGCGYCNLYLAQAEVAVYEKPSLESERVGSLNLGDAFVAKSGEVHTVPTRFEVHREHEGISPGDEVYALTYLGEGYFRVFHNGELKSADLGFSPWGGSGGKTCNEPAYCWGRLAAELDFTWWLWVVSETGLSGWVAADDTVREVPID